jgi:hypothetical protein
MKTALIKVIEKTINALENNLVEYNWGKSVSCNCGVLAQQVCSLREIEDSISRVHGSLWEGRAKNQCNKTGFDLHIVFKKLFDLGLSTFDIIGLEELSNTNILKRFDNSPKFNQDRTNKYCDNKDYLIKYLKAWREILLEEGEIEPSETIRYVTVEIDSKLKESIKKDLILS